MYRAGDPLYFSFITQDGTATAVNADSLPVVVLRRNGVNTTVVVTVTNNAAGDYTASMFIPLTWAGGDELELLVTATVKGAAGKAIFQLGTLDRADLSAGPTSANPGNPGNFAIYNRAKVLPFFLAARYERVVSIGVGNSNQVKDGYGALGGWSNALLRNGGLWSSGLLAAGGGSACDTGFACGGVQGSNQYGAATGAPVALDGLMPAGSSGSLPQYSYTAAGSLADYFFVGQTPRGVWFPGMDGNLRLHVGYGVSPGWAGTFTVGGRWNQSGPESNFGGIPVTPSASVSTGGGPGIVDGSWDIAANTFHGSEQVRFDFGWGSPTSTGSGNGPVFFSYWQLERSDVHCGFSHHAFCAAGGQNTKFILQAMQAFGVGGIKEHFREAMLYAGPSKYCLIRIASAFHDPGDATASWDKTSQSFIGPAGSTQQGWKNNTEAIVLLFKQAWDGVGTLPPSGNSLFFLIDPEHPQSTPDDANVTLYRAAGDALSDIYANMACVHEDRLLVQADLSARLMYEINDPVNGTSTPEPHLTYAGYDYAALAIIAALMPTGPEVMVDAANRARVTLATTQSFNNAGQTTPLPTTTAGTGGLQIVVNVKDSSSHANIVGASVVAGGAQVAAGTTDGSGNAALGLNAGTVTLTITAPGYGGYSGQQTIAAAGTINLTLTAVSIPAPAGPNQTTGYLTTRDGQDNPKGNVTITFELMDPASNVDAFDLTTFTATSDNSGLLTVSLRQNTRYRAKTASVNASWVTFRTGASTPFPLPRVLGMFS